MLYSANAIGGFSNCNHEGVLDDGANLVAALL